MSRYREFCVIIVLFTTRQKIYYALFFALQQTTSINFLKIFNKTYFFNTGALLQFNY